MLQIMLTGFEVYSTFRIYWCVGTGMHYGS